VRLEDLEPDLFELGLAIYLHHAYEGKQPPAGAQLDLSGLRRADDVLALFTEETPPNPGGESHRHLVLRLGNARYPHMKLALMEFVEPGEWFWSVDTHDRAPIRPDSPDWPRWQELRRHNLDVKRRVEEAWREAGIPTAKVVAQRLAPVLRECHGPLVLVVDDEEGMRSVAVNILQSEDYRVVEASSGPEALRLFKRIHPDLVLMDFEMPGMDGAEVCARLRELEERDGSGRHTPVLLATAGQVRLSETPGADGFLMKPYHRTLLLSFVAHQLPGKKRGRGGAGGVDGPGLAGP
jgi:CheY-like chemotaxis protein